MNSIYKIVNLSTNQSYIGTTCLAVKQRVGHHRYDARVRPEKGCSLKDFDFDNIDVIILEANLTLTNALIRERHYIHITPNCINKVKRPIYLVDELLKSKSLARQAQQNRRKILCECGISVNHCSYKRHLKTQVHKDLMDANV